MKYFVKYWMDDEEVIVTAEGLAEFYAQAQACRWEVVLTTITPTEMHFTAYEMETDIF